MKAVFWHYRFDDMKLTWSKQVQWIINSLLQANVEVKIHPNFKCLDLEHLPKYSFTNDYDTDICIYNHTDQSYIIGDVLKVKKNWFFKPTVPDEIHTTLDELGYGPYSSITYEKPDFENLEIGNFFETKVKSWIDSKISKWGNELSTEQEVKENDYYLVLGQCGGDSTVVHYDFGSHFLKLEQVVRELVRVGNKEIVVKLHPYTDGTVLYGKFSIPLKQKLEMLSPKVHVYTGLINIHNFIKKANCVFLANSGSGFECLMHHKPIIAWGYPEYRHVCYDLRHLADIHRAIKLDWFNSDKQDKFLYWYLEKYCFYNQQSCDNRVKYLLSKVSNG